MLNGTEVKIYCDGGARGNPGPAASAFVVKENEEVVYKQAMFLGKATNNSAEYQALILALKWVRDNKSKVDKKIIIFILDSQLVVKQVNGLFKVKDENIRNYFFTVKSLEKEIGSKLNYQLVTREKNKDADLLVNETLDEN